MSKKHWRIVFAVLLVGLLAFGGAMAGLADSPEEPDKPGHSDCPTPTTDLASENPEWFVQDPDLGRPSGLGAGDPLPYNLPLLDDCDDYGYLKVNYGDSVGADGEPALEDGWYYADMGDDEVTGTDDGFMVYIWNNGDGTFTWKSNYPVTYVYAKGGPQGGNMYIYQPASTCGTNLAQPGGGAFSHINFYYCVGQEELTVSKTVDTSFIRTHLWDIEKEVTTENEFTKVFAGEELPKIWLVGPGDEGDETATWEVCVEYLGFSDGGYNVSGTITVENTGDVDAVLTGYQDLLGGVSIDVVWDGWDGTSNFTLAVGATLTGTYSEDGEFTGQNVVTVYTERDSYSADEDIVWDDDPTSELNKVVNIQDVSDLFGTVNLGTVDADDFEVGDKECFDYDYDFAWVDYSAAGPYFYDNIATIVETGQSASAKLAVNWQEEELTVTKTVDTYFIRDHDWDIDKKVETENGYVLEDGTPKIWLYIDGSGNETATWTVDVTYLGYTDSEWNVSGTITVENTGDVDAVLTGYQDLLGGVSIDVDWDGWDGTSDFTLVVGATLTGTYNEDGYFEGNNVVTVTTQRDTYGDTKAIVWDDPETETLASVLITDESDLFLTDLGEQEVRILDTLDAADYDEGDVIPLTYLNDFAYDNYTGPSVINNTARIAYTDKFATAILKINTQEFIYDSAWAKGEDSERNEAVDANEVVSFCDAGFNNWGWTNQILPGTYNWDLWAGAAQCDTSKGTLVGSVTVVYDNDGYVNVTFNVFEGYDLKETHVYAGYDEFPQQQRGRRTVDTVAPGQYYNDSPFDGSEVYVIAHGVVGYPDPDFGPDPVE